jgi:putative exosortase-associated protein (TIGR04073 family)
MNYRSTDFFGHEVVYCGYYNKENVQFVSDSVYSRYHSGRLLDGAVAVPVKTTRTDVMSEVLAFRDQDYMAVLLRTDTMPLTPQVARYYLSSPDDALAPEELARRQPADQFGRGVCNILFGALEIPFNIIRLTNEEGDLPGISKGVGLGLWRFACREVVGVVELVTFPFGWTPIIEPEYVVQKKLGPNWKVNRPAFHKNY